MPKPKPTSTTRVHRALELQEQLRRLLGHAQVRVKPYGAHLLIQIEQGGEAGTIARLTHLGGGSYGAAFRPLSGRWEPLPGTGTLKEAAGLVVNLLGPYLQSY